MRPVAAACIRQQTGPPRFVAAFDAIVITYSYCTVHTVVRPVFPRPFPSVRITGGTDYRETCTIVMSYVRAAVPIADCRFTPRHVSEK